MPNKLFLSSLNGALGSSVSERSVSTLRECSLNATLLTAACRHQPSRRDATLSESKSRRWRQPYRASGTSSKSNSTVDSIQRVQRMRAYYTSTSWSRVLLVCIFTPLTSLAVITSLDCMQLGSPKLSSNENVAFWIRSIIATPIIVVGAVYLFHCCLPVLPMTYCEAMGVSFVSSVAGVAFAYGVSMALGFPVPFTLVIQSVAIMPTMIAGLYLLWRLTLRGNPSLQADLRRQTMAFLGQVGMIWVYPIYFFAFTSMPSLGQSVFTLVLPLIKLAFKNYFSHVLRQLDDIKPAFIVFNADVFSALYVANCLQTSQSLLNTLLVLVVDIVQMAIPMYDVHAVMLDIRSLVLFDQFDGTLLDLFVEMARSADVRKQLDRRSSSMKTHISRIHGAIDRRVVPPRNQVLHLSPLPVSHRTRLAAKISKVLYITEFVLLIEFVEVMIPVIYGLYLGIISNLPNRAYYPHLASLDTEELSHSISIITLNATLEFISFLVACRLLDRQLQLSSLRLLGFALESQRSLIQSSLMAWTSCVITQQAVEHTGMDFTLQFAWLHRPSP